LWQKFVLETARLSPYSKVSGINQPFQVAKKLSALKEHGFSPSVYALE
jgi:hypothetical protein